MKNASVVFRVPPEPGGLNFNPPFYAYTDANGSFQISLTPGRYDVHLDPPYASGYPSVKLNGSEFGQGNAQLNYTYTGTMISGDVTGLTGAPLTDAYIGCSSNSAYASAYSKNGHYSFVLPPGAYDMSAEYNSTGGYPSKSASFNLSAADTTIDFALTGNQVTVTVSLEGGGVLPGAYVSARSTAGNTQSNNRTAIDGTAVLYLPDGDYLYAAVAPDDNIISPVQGHLLVSGSSSLAVQFPGTRWDGTLRRASDNSPIATAYVRVLEVGAFREASTASDIQGRFHFYVAPNAGYTLTIYLQGSNGPLPGPYLSTTGDSTFDVVIPAP